MDTNELIQFSENTKRQAGFLLQSTNLLDILKEFGDIHIIGSYPLDIMYGPDIDILVETKDIKSSSMKALQKIVEKELFRKIEYGDFVKFPMDKRPKGYILVLKAEVEGVKWEVEVWFLDNVSEQLKYNQLLKSKINKDNRMEILKAKHERETSNTSKHNLSSYEIYRQVLGL